MGLEDDEDVVARILAERGSTGHDAILDTLAGFDAGPYLLAAGVAAADLAALRDRMVAG